MSSHSKSGIVLSGMMVALLASLYLWQRSQLVCMVYLPNGSAAVFVEGQITNVHWQRFEPRANSPSKRLGAQHVARVARYEVRQLLGKLRFPVPNPPRPVDFVGNIRAFPSYTGKTYLVADELLTGGESNWISFVFGGSRDATSGPQWVQANLNCIRQNGVMLSTLEQPYQPFSTTLCAVIVGPKTVSILPVHCLETRQPRITNE
jgi:hypothetical protein